MAKSFDDKVQLASEAINKLFEEYEQRTGKIIADILNEGGYDTDTINDDLEGFKDDDSSIMDDIKNNVTQKLRLPWNDKNQNLFFKALNDIFSNNITNYEQLMSGLATNNNNNTKQEEVASIITDKKSDKKPKAKTLADLNCIELVNVIEYIINDMNEKKAFTSKNNKANLYYHKDNIRNHIISQKWTGSSPVLHQKPKWREEISEALRKTITTTSLEKLRQKITTFDMKLFDNIKIKQFQYEPIQIRKEEVKEEQVSEHTEHRIERLRDTTKSVATSRMTASASSVDTKSMNISIKSIGKTRKEQNELLKNMDKRRFSKLVQEAISLVNKKLGASYKEIAEKAVMDWFDDNMDSNMFISLTKQIFCDKLQHLMARGPGAKLFNQIRGLIVDRTLIDLYDDEFYYIVQLGVDSINLENKGRFNMIDCNDIINYMKQIGLNGTKFTSLFTKKSFQSQIGSKLSKGTTNKLYKYLITIDIELVLKTMPKKGKKTGSKEAVHFSQKKKNDQRVKPKIKKEEEIKIDDDEKKEKKEKKEKREEIKIDDVDINKPLKCQSINEWKDYNSMQLRYAVQFVIIEFNERMRKKWGDNDKYKEKQIQNMDGLISFLYETRKMNGNELKMNKCEWAHLLYDNIKIFNNPSKKLMDGLRDYDVEEIPPLYLDLDLPFIFKMAIREQQKKSISSSSNTSSKLNENDILRAIQFKKYGEIVEDRKKFVSLLKNECNIAKGPSIKLRTSIMKYVKNNLYKYYKSNINININKVKKINKLNVHNHTIFNILKRYKLITECGANELKEIIKCCLDQINRKKSYNYNVEEILIALKKKNNEPKQIKNEIKIKSLKECDNKLFVKAIKKCIDQLLSSGRIKNEENSLGSNIDRDKLLNYLSSSNINGIDFEKKYPKKSRFAIDIFNGMKYTKQQKGIKTQLMKIYAELTTKFDFNTLSIVKYDTIYIEEDKQKEMNGKQFINYFMATNGQQFVEYIIKNTSIKDKNDMFNLYKLIIGFFIPIESRNNGEFYNLLIVFINIIYGVKIFDVLGNNNNNTCDADDKLKILNGETFINDTGLIREKFGNLLKKSKIFNIKHIENGMQIYDDLMDLNVYLKDLKKINQCNHNELIYMMKKYVIPQFNKKNKNDKLDKNIIIEFIKQNVDINGEYFQNDNRKLVGQNLKYFNENLKIGPIRRLCTHIDGYCVI